MMRVVKDLNLNISYFVQEKHLENELYLNSPIRINFVTRDSSYLTKYATYYLTFISNNEFVLKNSDKEEIGKHKTGDIISSEIGKFKIESTPGFNDWYLNKDLRVSIAPLIAVADNYRSSIQVYPVSKSTSVLMLTLQDPVIEKASNIIDYLIKQNNNDAIADKNQVSKNTADFINDRIQFITNELTVVETEAEDFKTKHKLTDVESESKIFLQSSTTSEMSYFEVGTQVQIANFMYDYIQKHSEPESLIPSNIGLSDGSSSSQIADYNKLVLDRNRLLKNSGAKNPVIENLTNQIIGLRGSIIQTLDSYRSTLQIKLREINKKEGQINSKIGEVPKYEREYRVIQRQQQIKESLYYVCREGITIN
jgi:uncharacterized protein involved in exopolysaccharide biosynthesis